MRRAFFHAIQNKTEGSGTMEEQRSNDNKFKFINPLLECDASPDTELKSFKNNISNIVSSYQSQKQITEAAVYFRDLNNGLYFNIGPNEEFSPASLLKIPLMIAYLKEAETDATLFSQDITYTEEYNLYEKQTIKPEVILEKGKIYNVKGLIGRMIIYSDNSAQAMLMKNADSFWHTPYEDLGIDIPTDPKTENFMSVKKYATFFRILYNASYLNRQDSNVALGILAQSKFTEGLVAGVPSDVNVAHKFGERTMGNTNQLHDCGIIYHPNRPYLLCVMTRGYNFNSLKKIIAEISKNVYIEVDSQSSY